MQIMVSTSAAKSFDRSLTSQEGQMKADSAKQISTTEADVLSPSASRTDDKETDAAIETAPLGSAGPDCKNMSSVSTSVNGKANQDMEIGNDGTKPSDEALRSSNDDVQSKKHVELPNLEDPQVQAVPADSSEDSDVMEQDVKVCDICGDAGREDLLAICSRCSDGAEHTYCMREMLQKVPDGEWFCEECKATEETENPKPGLHVEEKRLSKGSLSTQVLGKRSGENIGIDSSKKKQAVDRTIESPRGSNGVPASSRDSLLKNVNKGKSGVASNDISRSLRPSNISRLQVSKSTLLKSKSFSAFSMKPKGKQVAEGFRQKQKGPPSSDTRALGKSASFKYPNRELPNDLDLKAKLTSSKFSHAPEMKEPTSSNDQNTSEKNRLPRLDLDRPSSARSNSTHSGPKLERRDSNVAESDCKSGTTSQAANSIARRSAETAFGSGPPSNDGGCNASPRKKSNLISPRNGTGLSMPGGSRKTQVGLPRSQDSHSNSEVDVPSTRRGEMNFGNKATTAVTTSMLKRPGIYGKNKAQDKSENSSVPGGGSSQERSTLSDASKKPANGANSGKHMSSENGTQLNGLLNGFPKSRKVEKLEAGGQIQEKHVLKELSVLSSELLSSVRKTSIIPEHACIWNGGFKLHRSGEILDLHGGFQAHLPTNASPKVVEMATKFPEKIALTEVPRRSTWPVQFQDSGAKEANIALYFFARDMESYQKSYKTLLENLMKGDFALKGNLGDIELLVYPSSQLPEKSQRWNMSFYLWGLFRGRRANGVDHSTSNDVESSKKEKHKPDSEGKTEGNDMRESSLSGGSQVHDLDGKAKEPSSSLNAERCLFPVGSSHESTCSSERSSFSRSHGPDLELALGADANLGNKAFPLPWMEKKDDQEVKVVDVKGKEEEEGSASLSLSLSFPFPDDKEERKTNSLSKEKLVQEGTL